MPRLVKLQSIESDIVTGNVGVWLSKVILDGEDEVFSEPHFMRLMATADLDAEMDALDQNLVDDLNYPPLSEEDRQTVKDHVELARSRVQP